MAELKAGADGIVLAYIESFYKSETDHERALYGAMIVGALEQILENHLEEKEVNEQSDSQG